MMHVAAAGGCVSRCILTYEVQFSYSNTSHSFQRVNDRDTIFTSFLYDRSLEDKDMLGLLLRSSAALCFVCIECGFNEVLFLSCRL